MLGYWGLRGARRAPSSARRVELLRSRIEVVESLWEIGGRLGVGETKTKRRRTAIVHRYGHLSPRTGDLADGLDETHRRSLTAPGRFERRGAPEDDTESCR
jgi:hypothetical protein